jgi:hypothetical protein
MSYGNQRFLLLNLLAQIWGIIISASFGSPAVKEEEEEKNKKEERKR